MAYRVRLLLADGFFLPVSFIECKLIIFGKLVIVSVRSCAKDRLFFLSDLKLCYALSKIVLFCFGGFGWMLHMFCFIQISFILANCAYQKRKKNKIFNYSIGCCVHRRPSYCEWKTAIASKRSEIEVVGIYIAKIEINSFQQKKLRQKLFAFK